MKILVGPIIGKVTETTARILLEYDESGVVTVELNATGQQTKKVSQNLQARSPTIFNFTGLSPSTKYVVSVAPQQKQIISSFKTMNYSVKDLKVCWISCNDYTKNEGLAERNLWRHLSLEVSQDKYDLVVHMGDQVYLDSEAWHGNKENAYGRLKEQIFDKYPKNEWQKYKEQILEVMRDVYRQTWSFPPTAQVLANVPNIMIFDDHEIRDGWGYLQEDWDLNTEKFDYLFGQLSRIVYYEYQRQLRDDTLDLKDISKVKEEYFTLKIGKIGFYFCELRGDRTWHRQKDFDTTKQVITQKQWDKLDNALNEEFKDVENFVFVSQSAVVYLSSNVNNVFGKNAADFIEKWICFETEQHKLLKKLYDWKFQSGYNNREVTIVAGDLHIGGHTDIYFKDQKAFKQFTSSAITNGLKKGLPRNMNHIGIILSDKFGTGDFEYDHHGWTGQNNYGAIHFRNENGKNIVECWSIVAKDEDDDSPNPVTILDKIDNNNYIYDQQCQCCNCNIF